MRTRPEQVDFFVADQVGPAVLSRAVCRVLDRLWQAGPLRALVRVNDQAMMARLDDELWTFRDDAFIPHAPYDEGEGDDATSPVLLVPLGPEQQLPAELSTYEVLIDATGETPAPACVERFTRVAVVLDGDAGRREAGRERFREWRALGLTPQTHPLER